MEFKNNFIEMGNFKPVFKSISSDQNGLPEKKSKYKTGSCENVRWAGKVAPPH